MARTIAISKTINNLDGLRFCEVEVYGYPFVKPNSMICNLFIKDNYLNKILDRVLEPLKPFDNLKYFKKLITKTIVKCGVVCQQMSNCVSFTFETGGQCYLYSNTGGSYLPKNQFSN